MVPKEVLFVCLLWIGTLSAMPSHNDDGYEVPLRRNIENTNEDAFSGNVLRHRKNAQSSPSEYRQETSDPTSRMDLVKSIDDIIRSPYEGPHLESLQPLLQRPSFIRPARDSSRFQGNSSPAKRFATSNNKASNIDQLPQSNIENKFSYNKPPTSSVSSQKTPSFSGFKPQRPIQSSISGQERKPFDYSSQTFGSDSQLHFETIHDNFRDSFEPENSHRRPMEEHYLHHNRRPASHQSSSDLQRLPESIRPFSGSQRYSQPEPSYSANKKNSRYENVNINEPSKKSQSYSSFERPFRSSPQVLSRRHERNRRDLSTQGIDTNSIISNLHSSKYNKIIPPVKCLAKKKSTSSTESSNDNVNLEKYFGHLAINSQATSTYTNPNLFTINSNLMSAYKNITNRLHPINKRSLDEDFTHPDERDYSSPQNMKHSRGKRIVYPTSSKRDVSPAFIPGPSPPARILRPYNVIKVPSRNYPSRNSQHKRKRNSLRQRGFPRRSALRFSLPLFRHRRSLELDESQSYNQRSSGRPSDFPNFASIGGVKELQEGAKVAAGSFNHNINIPKVKIPGISVQQPIFRETYPFRNQVAEFFNHRTTIHSPIFSSKSVADNIVESFHTRTISKPKRLDIAKLKSTSPNAGKLKNEPQSLEKSHFAVYGSSSSQSLENKPDSFKVLNIANSELSQNTNHHHHQHNVNNFEGKNKFIEIKPEFPQHPYIAQESVPQNDFINVPQSHEYDLIPTYDIKQEVGGVFKPIIDFVKKFIP